MRRAFTLVELIVVIVVLAILAGVSVPVYVDYTARARTAKLQDYLGRVRSAIAHFRLNQSVNGTDRYPTWQELCTQGTVLDGFSVSGTYMASGSNYEFFINPFNANPQLASTDGTAAVLTSTQAKAGTVPAGWLNARGWVYWTATPAGGNEAYFYSASDAVTTVPKLGGGFKTANEL